MGNVKSFLQGRHNQVLPLRGKGREDSIVVRRLKPTVNKVSSLRDNSAPNLITCTKRYQAKFFEFYTVTVILHPVGAEFRKTMDTEISTAMVAEIGWVQNCLILEKCKDLKQTVYQVIKPNFHLIFLTEQPQ
jgi:hypothetical protein